MVRDSGIETRGTTIICNKNQILAYYADDFVLVGRTIGMLKEAITNLSKATKEMGLRINLQNK